jgi:hypothetical protein
VGFGQAACRPSLENSFKGLAQSFRRLANPNVKRSELLEEMGNLRQSVTAESKILRDELTRYCDESGLSITVCHTLDDYIDIVKKRRDLVVKRGVKRDNLPQHTAEENPASDKATNQDYHDSHCSRLDDFKTKGRYTASDPGDDVDNDSKEGEGLDQSVQNQRRLWDSE